MYEISQCGKDLEHFLIVEREKFRVDSMELIEDVLLLFEEHSYETI